MADDMMMMMNTDDLLKTASLLVEMEDYNTAMTAFNIVFNQDSKCIEAHHIRGYAGTYFENYEEAIIEFDRAIELEPGMQGLIITGGALIERVINGGRSGISPRQSN